MTFKNEYEVKLCQENNDIQLQNTYEYYLRFQ